MAMVRARGSGHVLATANLERIRIAAGSAYVQHKLIDRKSQVEGLECFFPKAHDSLLSSEPVQHDVRYY